MNLKGSAALFLSDYPDSLLPSNMKDMSHNEFTRMVDELSVINSSQEIHVTSLKEI